MCTHPHTFALGITASSHNHGTVAVIFIQSVGKLRKTYSTKILRNHETISVVKQIKTPSKVALPFIIKARHLY